MSPPDIRRCIHYGQSAGTLQLFYSTSTTVVMLLSKQHPANSCPRQGSREQPLQHRDADLTIERVEHFALWQTSSASGSSSARFLSPPRFNFYSLSPANQGQQPDDGVRKRIQIRHGRRRQKTLKTGGGGRNQLTTTSDKALLAPVRQQL